PVRTVGISPRTSFSTVRYLPAVVLQVWDSASSRLFADFHRSTHIASVVLTKKRTISVRFFLLFQRGENEVRKRATAPLGRSLSER
ncbi:MAG: hypothetical protein IJY53_00495, partial [Akkermansia sp.]|nr:hypothetical protein [Akkermansia sp.]